MSEHSGSSLPDPYCECGICINMIRGSFEFIFAVLGVTDESN